MSDSASGLTHLNAAGEARMVDVSAKDVTARTATAAGRVLLSPDRTLAADVLLVLARGDAARWARKAFSALARSWTNR